MDAPDLGIDVPEITHFALVVRDLYATMDGYANTLGMDTWTVKRFEPPHLTHRTYRGEPAEFTMRIGKASVGDVAFELIEPLSGESYYTEQLDERGEGLNHIACFAFDSPEDVVETLTSAGYPVVQSGSFMGGNFWYVDTTPALGTAFEVTRSSDAEYDGTEVYEAG